MADMSQAVALPSNPAGFTGRRDFLTMITLAGAAATAGALVWPFVDSMNPSEDTLAEGAAVDVDVSKIAPDQQIVLMWRGRPMFIARRSAATLQSLQNPVLIDRLRDPGSDVAQQPAYALNWHRSLKPEISVLVGVCTHLGCIPTFFPHPNAATPAVDWLGGYFCFCHGSKYDAAGRVLKGVPAPFNLPVPPHHFADDATLRIGANPPGQTFDLNSVVQI